MASTLKLEIVTPEAKVYSEEVDSVRLPGAEGELGIYPNHAPLMAQVKAGELIAHKENSSVTQMQPNVIKRHHPASSRVVSAARSPLLR